jgi:glycine oxidase
MPQRVVYSQGVYLVPRRDGRVIVGATTEFENYDKTVKAGAVLELLGNAVHLMPELRGARFEKAWAGLRPCTPDRLPVLGPCPVEGLYYATGHFRNGILLTPFTAQVLAELIVTGATDLDLSPFSVSRFSPRESHRAAASGT